jgi:hypothetical protein
MAEEQPDLVDTAAAAAPVETPLDIDINSFSPDDFALAERMKLHAQNQETTLPVGAIPQPSDQSTSARRSSRNSASRSERSGYRTTEDNDHDDNNNNNEDDAESSFGSSSFGSRSCTHSSSRGLDTSLLNEAGNFFFFFFCFCLLLCDCMFFVF